MTPATQDTIEGQQHHNVNQKVMVKFAQNEKVDTLRRDISASTFISLYASHASLALAEPLTIDPSGQTPHSHPSRPLHQQISIYRL
jgi:hypothetical protein